MAVASLSLRGVRTLSQRGSSSFSSLETSSWSMCWNSGRQMSSGRDEEETSKGAAAVRQQLEAAARENRLDFITAARILFSTPPKPRKFGLDFHLWQFFVACLPPFAVYLTAQYSRYEMRRMEKERDDAEQLKQDALAEQLAARLADDDRNEVVNNSTGTLKTPGSGELAAVRRGNEEEEAKLKRKDPSTVTVREKDFLAMKARLDAMEQKVQMLESARPGTTSVSPFVVEPKAQGGFQRRDSQSSAQVTDKAEAGGEDHKKLDKKRDVGLMGEENQKGVQVTSNTGRWQWFGNRSVDTEQELSK